MQLFCFFFFFCLSHTSTLHFVSPADEDTWSVWAFSPSCRASLELCLALRVNKPTAKIVPVLYMPQKSSWEGRTLYSGRCWCFPALSKGNLKSQSWDCFVEPICDFWVWSKGHQSNGNLCWFLWYPGCVSRGKAAKCTADLTLKSHWTSAWWIYTPCACPVWRCGGSNWDVFFSCEWKFTFIELSKTIRKKKQWMLSIFLNVNSLIFKKFNMWIRILFFFFILVSPHPKLSFVEKLEITVWGAVVEEEAALSCRNTLFHVDWMQFHHWKLPAQITTIPMRPGQAAKCA